MSESKTLKIFESDYYRIYTNSVRIIGLWPYENIHQKRIIRFFITILLTTFMILQGIRLYEELGNDIDVVLEIIGSIAYFSGCILKYLTTIKAQADLQFLYEQIQGHWETITNKKERQILEQSASESQLLSKLYMGAAYSALVVYSTSPVLVPIILDITIPLNESRKKTFPYFIEYFIDTEIYYYYLLVHGTIVFTISVLVYISIDTMYAACCQHLCGLFDIVEHRLKEAVRTNSNILYLELDRNDILIHKLLNQAITLHQDSIELSKIYLSHSPLNNNNKNNNNNNNNNENVTRNMVGNSMNKGCEKIQTPSIAIIVVIQLKIIQDNLNDIIFFYRFAVLIENTYALCYLLVLGLNLIVIVICAVDIVINLDDMNQIIRLTILYIAFSFHLFFNSVPGQRIHDKSVNVMNSAYFCEWYNLPLNARKLIQLIIHRSLIPCQFTAGALFVLNIENFGSIMKSSMSYITVLSSIR